MSRPLPLSIEAAGARAAPSANREPLAAEVLAEERDRERPRAPRCGHVRAVLTILLAQETVTGTLEDVRLEGLVQPVQHGFRRRDRRVHAGIVAAVKSED